MSYLVNDRVVSVATGRRGTVLRVTLMSDRFEVGFDAPPSEDPQWVWAHEVRPLNIVDHIGEIEC